MEIKKYIFFIYILHLHLPRYKYLYKKYTKLYYTQQLGTRIKVVSRNRLFYMNVQ